MEEKQIIIERWEKLGFLKGFEGQQKEIAACFYNSLAKACLEKEADNFLKNVNKNDSEIVNDNFDVIRDLSFVIARKLVEKPEIYVLMVNDDLDDLSKHMLRMMILSFNEMYLEQEDGTDKDVAYCEKFSKQFTEDYLLISFLSEEEEEEED